MKKQEEQKKWYQDKTPQTMHCRRCQTLMENGECPTCGFKTYVPMNEEKKRKIRLILGGVCVVAFLVIYAILNA